MWNIKKIISKGDYLYALVPEHPHATKNGYVLLHRVIIKNYLGRLLNANEVVHHIDENKKNNSIENLQVLDSVEHNRMHQLKGGRKYVKLKCPLCGKTFDLSKSQSFLQKPPYTLRCNFCSPNCRGKFARYKQLHGLTPKLESAISENILLEYRKYSTAKDNSEETSL